MGLGLNDMGLKIYVKCAYDHASFQRRKTLQENTCHGRIIYQSDGNLKTGDKAKENGHPRSFANTISQIRSKVLVFGQVNILSQVFMVFRDL